MSPAPGNHLLHSLLWLITATSLCAVESADETPARLRAFLNEQAFAPIEVKPNTRYQRDVDEAWLKWAERTVIAPFAQRAARRPNEQAEAVDFVRQGIRFQRTHGHPDPSVTPLSLIKRGNALLNKGKVSDPLVIMLTGWAETVLSQKRDLPIDRLEEAAQHPAVKQLPPCTQLLIFAALRDVQSLNDEDLTFAEETLEAAQSALEDPASFTDDEDEVLVEMMEPVFERMLFREHDEKVRQMCEQPSLSEWTFHALHGRYESTKAWKILDLGEADGPSDSGWLDYHNHLAQARESLLKAWQLKPDRPAPAVAMLQVVKGGGGKEDDTKRLWFDRAVAAQFDCLPAYREFLSSITPYWEGSVEQMKALGVACAETGRHDTDVPKFIFEVAKKVLRENEEWESTYKDPVMVSAFVAVGEALIRRPTYPFEKEQLLADHAVRCWVGGDLKRANEVLKQVASPFPARARRLAGDFDAYESQIRSECVIHAAGKYDEWKAADSLYKSKDLAKAESAFAALIAAMGKDAPAWLKGRLATAKSEIALDSGAWIPMRATPSLEEWAISKGRWEGTPDGVLINHGEDDSAFIRFHPRVGQNLEIRGEYEVHSPADESQGLGIVLGDAQTGTLENWVLCQQYRPEEEYQATIFDRYYAVGEPVVNLSKPRSKWTFFIRCKDGVFTYLLNGVEVCKDHIPRDHDSRQPLTLEPDGCVGFASYYFMEGNTTRILKAEVRRLK